MSFKFWDVMSNFQFNSGCNTSTYSILKNVRWKKPGKSHIWIPEHSLVLCSNLMSCKSIILSLTCRHNTETFQCSGVWKKNIHNSDKFPIQNIPERTSINFKHILTTRKNLDAVKMFYLRVMFLTTRKPSPSGRHSAFTESSLCFCPPHTAPRAHITSADRCSAAAAAAQRSDWLLRYTNDHSNTDTPTASCNTPPPTSRWHKL